MKLEIGKTYRTRNGQRAYILDNNTGVYYGKTPRGSQSWLPNGTAFWANSEYGIIAEWIDFVPGRYYKTSSGHQAVIYQIYPGQEFAIHGAVQFSGNWVPNTWKENGTDGFYDLMEEWVDKPMDWSVLPKWANWIYKLNDGRWRWTTNEPTWIISYWNHQGEFGTIPPEYTPSYNDDIKNFKMRRP